MEPDKIVDILFRSWDITDLNHALSSNFKVWSRGGVAAAISAPYFLMALKFAVLYPEQARKLYTSLIATIEDTSPAIRQEWADAGIIEIVQGWAEDETF